MGAVGEFRPGEEEGGREEGPRQGAGGPRGRRDPASSALRSLRSIPRSVPRSPSSPPPGKPGPCAGCEGNKSCSGAARGHVKAPWHPPGLVTVRVAPLSPHPRGEGAMGSVRHRVLAHHWWAWGVTGRGAGDPPLRCHGEQGWGRPPLQCHKDPHCSATGLVGHRNVFDALSPGVTGATTMGIAVVPQGYPQGHPRAPSLA